MPGKWNDDRVTLMTVHAAKGLEFPVVFMIALEEGIFPHERSRNDEEQLEEERRLLFVAITRAKEELHLSRACYRHYRGQLRPTVPSAFLMELPQEELDFQQPKAVCRRRCSRARPLATSSWPTDWAMTTRFGCYDRMPMPIWSSRRANRSAVAEACGCAFRRPTHDRRRTCRATGHSRQPRGCDDRNSSLGRERISPEVFHQGMIVRHPKYGLGKIIALSGSGAKRKATVMFAAAAGEKRFLADATAR